MLKVHSGHRYRPHRMGCLCLNTQVREKEGRDRPFSVFKPHNREQTYASGIPFCSVHCPKRTDKYTFYPIKMQENSTKTSSVDNHSAAAPRLPSAFLPVFCRLPSAFHPRTEGNRPRPPAVHPHATPQHTPRHMLPHRSVQTSPTGPL